MLTIQTIPPTAFDSITSVIVGCCSSYALSWQYIDEEIEHVGLTSCSGDIGPCEGASFR